MINKQLVGSGRLAGTGWVGQREGGEGRAADADEN